MRHVFATFLATTLLAACAAPQDSGSTREDAPGWRILGANPAPRSGATTAYDAARDRLLVLGGGSSDLWAESLSGTKKGSWQKLDARGEAPPPVALSAIVDPRTDRLLVFSAASLDQVWSLPLSGKGDWEVQKLAGAPHVELNFALAVDPSGKKVYAYTSGQPELWALPLDGAAGWSLVTEGPETVGFSCNDTLYLDAARDRLLVLSGGWPRGDVYSYALSGGSGWVKLSSDGTTFNYGSWTTYDSVAGRFLVEGPTTGEWIWSFAVDAETPAWEQLAVSGEQPDVSTGATGVFVSSVDGLVTFGGSGGYDGAELHNATWKLSLGESVSWSRVGEVDEVAHARYGAVLAFDDGSGKIVRSAGEDEGLASTTDVFDAEAAGWRSVGGAPAIDLAYGAGAWDPVHRRIVAFGGLDATAQDVTLAVDPATGKWTTLATTGQHPAGRSSHSIVLDRKGRRLVLFGGAEATADQNEGFFNDVWAFSLDHEGWSRIDVEGAAPPARSGHAAAFDEAGQRMLIRGGTHFGGDLADAWILELAGTPRWVEVHAEGKAPPASSDHYAAFDPEAKRFVYVVNPTWAGATPDDGALVFGLTTDGGARWEAACSKGLRPSRIDGAVWADGGLFATAQGSAFRFGSFSTSCD